MNNFKKILFLTIIFFCQTIKIESLDNFEELEQKIQSLENLIFNLSKTVSYQQEFLLKLEKELITLNKNEKASITDEASDDDEDDENEIIDDDHRLTLRIPKSLMKQVDIKRKQRLGKISRNLWILETIEKATKKK